MSSPGSNAGCGRSAGVRAVEKSAAAAETGGAVPKPRGRGRRRSWPARLPAGERAGDAAPRPGRSARRRRDPPPSGLRLPLRRARARGAARRGPARTSRRSPRARAARTRRRRRRLRFRAASTPPRGCDFSCAAPDPRRCRRWRVPAVRTARRMRGTDPWPARARHAMTHQRRCGRTPGRTPGTCPRTVQDAAAFAFGRRTRDNLGGRSPARERPGIKTRAFLPRRVCSIVQKTSSTCLLISRGVSRVTRLARTFGGDAAVIRRVVRAGIVVRAADLRGRARAAGAPPGEVHVVLVVRARIIRARYRRTIR